MEKYAITEWITGNVDHLMLIEVAEVRGLRLYQQLIIFFLSPSEKIKEVNLFEEGKKRERTNTSEYLAAFSPLQR